MRRNQNAHGGQLQELSGAPVRGFGWPLHCRVFIMNAYLLHLGWDLIPSSWGSLSGGRSDFVINFCGEIQQESSQLCMRMVGLS